MKQNAVNMTLGVALSAVCVSAATAAQAQQVTGTLGSPSATTTSRTGRGSARSMWESTRATPQP